MVSIKIINLLFFLILMIVSTHTNDEVPYWTEMRQILKYQAVDTRIIGGKFAVEKQAPWMVSLVTKIDLEHFCGGALIGERTVLTAAHCFIDEMTKDNQIVSYLRPDQILVKYDGLNKHLLSKSVRVIKIIMHPKWYYGNKTEDHYFVRGDIAIIHMQQPVIESDTVNIIPIIDETPPPGSEATLTGWGLQRYRENITQDDYPVMLKTVRLKLLSKHECNLRIDKHLRQYIQLPRLFICAGNPTGTACSGDSGSALVIEGKLMGINSHGLQGCPLNGSIVFSNPVEVRTWINNNIL